MILFCRPRRFLAARVALDAGRLALLSPTGNLASLTRHLEGLERVAAGDPAAGPIAGLAPSERFHWLVAPASTVVQPGPVHTGLCDDPAARLEALFAALVL